MAGAALLLLLVVAKEEVNVTLSLVGVEGKLPLLLLHWAFCFLSMSFEQCYSIQACSCSLLPGKRGAVELLR